MNTYYVELELEGRFYLLKIVCDNLKQINSSRIEIDDAVVDLPIGFTIDSIEKAT